MSSSVCHARVAVAAGIAAAVVLALIGVFVLRSSSTGRRDLPVAITDVPQEAFRVRVDGIVGGAVTAGGVLVIPVTDGDEVSVLAVDAADGAERWIVDLGDGFDVRLAFADVVLVTHTARTDGGGEVHRVLGIDPQTGDVLWADEGDDPIRIETVGDVALVVEDADWARLDAATGEARRLARDRVITSQTDEVLIEQDGGDVTVVDLQGAEVAEFHSEDLEDDPSRPFDATRSRLLVGLDDELVAIDAEGQEVWSSRLDAEASGVTVLAGGLVLVTHRDGTQVFDADGEERWSDRDLVVLFGDPRLGAAFDGPDLLIVRLADGEAVSTIEGGADRTVGVADGVFYVSSDDGDAIRGIATGSGQPLWSVDVDRASPPLGSVTVLDGMLVLMTAEDELTVLRM